MQISKEHYAELQEQINILTNGNANREKRLLDLEDRVDAGDRILDKILRAATGLPLIVESHNQYGMSPGYSDFAPPHRCTPLTPEELKQGELEALREQATMLTERLAAVKAIAEFAKEHKL